MDREDTGLQMLTPLKLLGREGSEASNHFQKPAQGVGAGVMAQLVKLLSSG